MSEILTMGAPVYWVHGRGLSLNSINQQNLVCGGSGCNNDSIITKLYAASNYPEMFAFSFYINFS